MHKLIEFWRSRGRWSGRAAIALGVGVGIHALSLLMGGGRVTDETTGEPLEGVIVWAV